MTLHWAIHMLNGVSSPANASYSIAELVHQLKDSGAKAIFTCAPLLHNAREAAAAAGLDEAYVFVIDLPAPFVGDTPPDRKFCTIQQLVDEGALCPRLPSMRWEENQGERQTALLCYSSGTSGLPVRVIHHKAPVREFGQC